MGIAVLTWGAWGVGAWADEAEGDTLRRDKRTDLTDKSLITTQLTKKAGDNSTPLFERILAAGGFAPARPARGATVRVRRAVENATPIISFSIVYADTKEETHFKSFDSMVEAIKQNGRKYVYHYVANEAVNHPLTEEETRKLRTVCNAQKSAFVILTEPLPNVDKAKPETSTERR